MGRLKPHNVTLANVKPAPEPILGQGMDTSNSSQTRDQFLATLRQCGLFDEERLQAEIALAPPEARADADALSEFLTRRGRLSPFQARKLREGNYLGLVLGPYQIVTPIGRGGMGTVYLARHALEDRLVALKVLPPKKAKTEE